MTVGSILDKTDHDGTGAETLLPTQTVRDAVAILSNRKIGAVLIVDEETSRPVGILSERDIIRVLGTSDAEALALPVTEVMTPDPVMCDRKVSIDQALKIMTEKKCRHLPILDGDTVIGVMSARDIMVYMVESASRQERERIVAMIALA